MVDCRYKRNKKKKACKGKKKGKKKYSQKQSQSQSVVVHIHHPKRRKPRKSGGEALWLRTHTSYYSNYMIIQYYNIKY